MAFDDPLTASRYDPPPVPPGTGLLGMRLFLMSLFMLFAAAIIGYVLIRVDGPKHPPPGALRVPRLLWVSTAIVIAISVAMARALAAVRRERQRSFMGWLWVALALAVAFLAVQTPAMIQLLREHHRLATHGGMFLYGLVFVLVLLHALHVLGGLIAMVRVVQGGRRGLYDHENFNRVRFAAMYWHFLDVIWIAMFLTFLFTA